MLLSEHVYRVAITFKMTKQVEQRICIIFCIKFERSSSEIIWMIQKATVPIHASRLVQTFLVRHQITQMSQPPYSPDLVPCNFWLFPRLKSPSKGKRFQTVHEIQENTTGQMTVIERTEWGSKVSPLKRTKASLSYVQCFLYLVYSSINVSIFHITWLDTSYTQENWKHMSSSKCVYMSICSNIIYNSQKVEKIHVTDNRYKMWYISIE